MRLKLLFKLETPELPKDYRSIFLSFLKRALSQYGEGKFFKKYFSGTDMKDYCYTVIFQEPRFVEEKILLDHQQFQMIFSADDRDRTGLLFFAAFLQQKQRVFPLPDGNTMTLEQISQMREDLIINSKVLFRTATGGGLVVREHNRETNKDRYYTFQDPEFQENIKRVLLVQARRAGFSDEDAKQVKVQPVSCKKVLVKNYGVYIDVTVGILQMEGKPELLQYFYQAGLGSRHSMSFGLLDLVSQESREEGRL